MALYLVKFIYKISSDSTIKKVCFYVPEHIFSYTLSSEKASNDIEFTEEDFVADSVIYLRKKYTLPDQTYKINIEKIINILFNYYISVRHLPFDGDKIVGLILNVLYRFDLPLYKCKAIVYLKRENPFLNHK